DNGKGNDKKQDTSEEDEMFSMGEEDAGDGSWVDTLEDSGDSGGTEESGSWLDATDDTGEKITSIDDENEEIMDEGTPDAFVDGDDVDDSLFS
ncbi:MAG: hypothetical protein OCC49_20260, partial [Fibrobacterales bacterium]